MNFLKFLKRYPLIMAFVVSIAVANIWDLVQNAKKIEDPATTMAQTTTQPAETTLATGQPLVTETTAPAAVFQTVDDSYFSDALFIGDSRTEGLALYGSLTNADFFSSVGLSIFKVTEKAAGNPNTGESVTLSQKLAQKQYGKVYIMLGLNELGTGTTESWAQTYAGVISQIRQAQPNAIIYLQSILVVAASQDNPGGAINNATVNARNQALEALAGEIALAGAAGDAEYPGVDRMITSTTSTSTRLSWTPTAVWMRLSLRTASTCWATPFLCGRII